MATVPDTNPYLSAKRAEEIAESRLIEIHSEFLTPLQAVEFSIRYIETLLTFPRIAKRGAYTAYYQMRRWLPYHAQTLSDESLDTQILVNRNYKPLGLRQIEKWVDYRNFKSLHTKLSPTELALVSGPKCSVGYLYHDGSRPWSSKEHARIYLVQLKRLRSVLENSR